MNKIKTIKSRDNLFQSINAIVFTIIVLLCLYPFFNMFLISLSDPKLAAQSNVVLFPVGITFNNYLEVFILKGLFQAFLVSVARTVAGTVITLFFTSMLAYTLTKRELVGRKIFYRITVTSMYLNAGLIPWYLTMRNLQLKDSFLVYILPSAVAVFSLILIKTYIEQIHPSIEESALIDGAGFFKIFLKIVMPITKPILAAVVVFTAIAQWNSWIDNLLLINNNHNLNTLQLVLLNYLNQAEAFASQARANGGQIFASGYVISPYSIRVTITMIVVIPILLVYPAAQKYFVSGIMLGAVKG